MSTTFEYTGVLHVEDCVTCGVTFGFPQGLQRELRRNHNSFYCPNGHGQHYAGESAEERLRRQLRQEKEYSARLSEAYDRVDAQARKARKDAGIAKAQLTKTRKRIENGVCPHCNRTFKDVARHMQSKHTDVLEARTNEQTAVQ